MIIIFRLLLSIHATTDYEPVSRAMSYVSLPIPWDQSAQYLDVDRYLRNNRGFNLSSDLLPRRIQHHVMSARQDHWGGLVGARGRLQVSWGSDQPVALRAEDDDGRAHALWVQRSHHVPQDSPRLGLQPLVASIDYIGRGFWMEEVIPRPFRRVCSVPGEHRI